MVSINFQLGNGYKHIENENFQFNRLSKHILVHNFKYCYKFQLTINLLHMSKMQWIAYCMSGKIKFIIYFMVPIGLSQCRCCSCWFMSHWLCWVWVCMLLTYKCNPNKTTHTHISLVYRFHINQCINPARICLDSIQYWVHLY